MADRRPVDEVQEQFQGTATNADVQKYVETGKMPEASNPNAGNTKEHDYGPAVGPAEADELENMTKEQLHEHYGVPMNLNKKQMIARILEQ